MTTLGNGLTLSYVDEGDRSAPAVLLLGGLTDSWRTYERIVPQLARSVRAIAPSARGHGSSDKPAAGYRTRQFAADLALFVASLDLKEAVVVGHSSASLVARRFALDEPTRTRGLVLESSPVTLRDHPTLKQLVSNLATMTDPLDPRFVSRFVAGTALRLDPAFLSQMTAESARVPARVWQQGFAGLLEDDDTAELQAILAPTLLIWGDRDALVSRDQQDKLTSLIGPSRLIVYAGIGHTPHWEAPSRFADDLGRFVSSLE